jgi:CRP/FNR family transcriptional regulator, cyclic AMP receptor protein
MKTGHFPHSLNISLCTRATPFVERINEIIERISLFEDFEPAEISVLASYMTCYQAPMGIEVIREGEIGDFMLLVLNGTLEVVKKDSNGLPTRIGTAGPGKTLGEMSVIDGEPRFGSCVSLTDVQFGVLDREQLTRLIADEPKVGIKLLMQFLLSLNQRLRQVSGQLMVLMEQRERRIGR